MHQRESEESFGRPEKFFVRWGGWRHIRGGGPVVASCRSWAKPAPRPRHRWRARNEGRPRGHNRVGTLQLFGGLWSGRGGWRRGVKRCGGLGFTRPIRGRSVYTGGGGVGNTKGSEAGKKGLDVVRIRDSESAVKTVMR